uniref:LIM and SH3 domain protein 1 n=3 Tax=Passeriformes TaxID=9126 RepID=A0A674GUN6_TAEGU
MNPNCARCGKIVYPTEKVNCLDKFWHKSCFHCETCKMTLNMKNYKGYEKKPYCNAHYPKQSFTMVADTPENLRLKQQSELQSQIRYKEEFEKNKGRGFSVVADTPELQRIRKTQDQISNIKYHEEFERSRMGPGPSEGSEPERRSSQESGGYRRAEQPQPQQHGQPGATGGWGQPRGCPACPTPRNPSAGFPEIPVQDLPKSQCRIHPNPSSGSILPSTPQFRIYSRPSSWIPCPSPSQFIPSLPSQFASSPSSFPVPVPSPSSLQFIPSSFPVPSCLSQSLPVHSSLSQFIPSSLPSLPVPPSSLQSLPVYQQQQPSPSQSFSYKDPAAPASAPRGAPAGGGVSAAGSQLPFRGPSAPQIPPGAPPVPQFPPGGPSAPPAPGEAIFGGVGGSVWGGWALSALWLCPCP